MKEITTIIVALKSRKSFITSQATFSQSIILTEKYLKKKKKEENLFYNIKRSYCHNKNKNIQAWGKKSCTTKSQYNFIGSFLHRISLVGSKGLS